jgi:hypothetical protein
MEPPERSGGFLFWEIGCVHPIRHFLVEMQGGKRVLFG